MLRSSLRQLPRLRLLEWKLAIVLAAIVALLLFWLLPWPVALLAALPVFVVVTLIFVVALLVVEQVLRTLLSLPNRPVADDRVKVKAIIQGKVAAMFAGPWEDLDTYGDQEETVALPSGQELRVVSAAFWDMDEWGSAMCIQVSGIIGRGLLEWSYEVWNERGDPDDDIPPPPPGHPIWKDPSFWRLNAESDT
ncbi:MAG: hypothetical protein WDZ37_06640 [Solirubrobacterales bacterium]